MTGRVAYHKAMDPEGVKMLANHMVVPFGKKKVIIGIFAYFKKPSGILRAVIQLCTFEPFKSLTNIQDYEIFVIFQNAINNI